MNSTSKQSATRYEDSEYDVNVINPDTQSAITASMMLPSQVVEPTRVNTPPQQGSTGPDDGSRVHFGEKSHHHGHHTRDQKTNEGLQESENVPFKEQVIGVAQKARGTLTGNAELKEHGEQILQGNTTHAEELQQERAAKHD